MAVESRKYQQRVHNLKYSIGGARLSRVEMLIEVQVAVNV